MGFLAVVLFSLVFVAFVVFKGSYFLLNVLQIKNRPLDKEEKVGIATVITFVAIVTWLLLA
ncbi:MAG: hypothetical protein EOO14_13165 [Chitinophagaceae bacterium]|nr:MAG: hypothetical protein EOO14_13165 [Chitinophagaceae bacterium]